MPGDGAGVVGRVGAGLLRTRWVVRLPVLAYRYGLGRLFGSRVVMIEHTGRRTHRPHLVCVEVIERTRPDEFVVASGSGVTADWYRNLVATPQCRVSVGRARSTPALAHRLSDAEATQSLARYRRAHPRSWYVLRPTIAAAGGDPEHLAMMALHLSADRPRR